MSFFFFIIEKKTERKSYSFHKRLKFKSRFRNTNVPCHSFYFVLKTVNVLTKPEFSRTRHFIGIILHFIIT